MLDKWFKEFGSDTVAFYYGSQPFLATKNLDLAKQIIIKDFQKFRNRTVSSLLNQMSADEKSDHILIL